MDRKRAILLLTLLCVLVGIVYAVRSPGTYQDDDLDRYFMARHALTHPVFFLDAWGMPLPLLIYAIPARVAGYLGVEITTVLLTAGAALLTALAASALGIGVPALVVLLVFFQPMVLELSYSALAEPTAALILAGVLWAWYTGRADRAVLLAGLLPVARIETGVLTLVVLAAAWSRVGWRVRLGALVPVLLWNGLGALTSGDPFYVLALGGTKPFHSLGVGHYLRNAGVIFGSGVVLLAVWGMVFRGFERLRKPAPEGFPVLALVLFGTHLAVLTLLAWEALPFGRSVGFLRHVVASAPALGLVAGWGAAVWVRPGAPARFRWVVAGLWTGFVAVLLSHRLVEHSFIRPGRAEGRWIETALVAGIGLVPFRFLLAGPSLRAALIGLVVVGAALASVPPKGLNPERYAVKTAVDQLRTWRRDSAIVYTNHPWFVFLTGRDRYDTHLTRPLTLENLESCPPGAVVLWENHYGTRLWGDVPLERLQEDPRFQRLMELTAGIDRNFHVVMFLRRD